VIYLDTSVVGALFFREPGVARVLDLWSPCVARAW
jgi:hypothetical protein